MKLMKLVRRSSAALFSGLLLTCHGASAAVLHSDNFNTGASAANYAVATSDATSSFPTFAYDYLAAMGIPSAPSSGDGSTVGLKLDANRNAPNAAEAVTLFTNLSFSGDYTVKFDAWLNTVGAFPAGGSGSTNFLTAGVGSNGTTNHHVPAAATGSGGWTAVDGENGNGNDYRMYKTATLQTASTGQYAAGSLDGDNAYYSSLGSINVADLPVQGASNGGPASQTGTSYAGSFGMAWHVVQLVVDADGGTGGAASMKWYVDNLLIGTLDAGNPSGSFSTTGRVALGYSDPTSNLSGAPSLTFALIDNLSVTEIPEPSTIGLGMLALTSLVALRRRS